VTPCSRVDVYPFQKEILLSTQGSHVSQAIQQQPASYLLDLGFYPENRSSTFLRNVPNDPYNYMASYKIWGAHSCGYKVFYLLGYDTVKSVERHKTFRRNMSPSSSGSKNKTRNQYVASTPKRRLTFNWLHGVISSKTAALLYTVSYLKRLYCFDLLVPQCAGCLQTSCSRAVTRSAQWLSR
jgi:hypothetical protein